MMTVYFGTAAQATAVTSLAPSLAMPPASAACPTMKPEMFCRNSSGMPSRQHSSMKCVPFSALSENRMPLLARMPTGHAVDVGEAADQRRAVERLELVEPRADRPGAR